MLIDREVRVDKWLWAIRVFKTRSQATEACRKGRVFIDRQPVKPSRILKTGDVVQVRKSPVTYSYRVLGLLGKRLSAKAIQEFAENITPQEEMDKLKMREDFYVVRDKGAGRPTKKERRILDRLRRD
jgi:ribosome-associated heat shock protein Hsp15